MEVVGWFAVYLGAECVFAFICIIGNMMILLAIIRNKTLHNMPNFFIGNLALADMAVGIFAPPSLLLSYFAMPNNKYGCIFIYSIIMVLTDVSIITMLLIAVERFTAVRFPFIYSQYASYSLAIKVNITVWISGSILGFAPMFGWNIAPDNLTQCRFMDVISFEYIVYFRFVIMTLIPLGLMFFIYLYVFNIVLQHARQVKLFNALFVSNENSKWGKEFHAACMFAEIFIGFCVCWLPINIVNCIILICPTCRVTPDQILVSVVLSHAHSGVNPFIYAANNSRIKAAIIQHLQNSARLPVDYDSNFRGFTTCNNSPADVGLNRTTGKKLSSLLINSESRRKSRSLVLVAEDASEFLDIRKNNLTT